VAREERGTCWILEMLHEDAYRNSEVVYLDESKALVEAARMAAALAALEIENLEEAGDDDRLKETVDAFGEGRYRDAYVAWADYAEDVESVATVVLTEVELIR